MSFREIVGNLKAAVTPSYVGKDGTLLVDTSTQQVYVHDGVTRGGTLLGGGNVLLSRVALTAAQISASHVAPITLVAAPGAGKAIMLLQSVYCYKFGTVAFTNASSIGGCILYNSLAGAIVDTSNLSQYADNNIFAGVASAATIGLNNGQNVVANAPLVYGGGTYAGGNGTGSITVAYYVVTL